MASCPSIRILRLVLLSACLIFSLELTTHAFSECMSLLISPLKQYMLSHLQFFTIPWTEPTRPLHPQDFPGKNTGVGCHSLLQGNLPNPGIEPTSLLSPALARGFFTTAPPGKLATNNSLFLAFKVNLPLGLPPL